MTCLSLPLYFSGSKLGQLGEGMPLITDLDFFSFMTLENSLCQVQIVIGSPSSQLSLVPFVTWAAQASLKLLILF